MESRHAVIVLLVGIAVIGVVPATATANDRVDSCSDAPVVGTNQTINGTIDDEDDTDVVKIRLTEGERIDFTTSLPADENRFAIDFENADGVISVEDTSNVNYWYNLGNMGVDEFTGGVEASWDVWAEESGSICLSIADRDAESAYEWEITMETDTPSGPDQWSDSGEDAEIVDSSATYTGELNTPNDRDVLKISMEEGDHLDISALAPPAEENFQFEFETSDNMGISVKNTTNTDYWYHYVDNSRGVEEFTGGLEGSWEIWAEDDGVVTLSIYDYGGTFPYDWELAVDETSAPREDQWADSGGNAEIVDSNGTYTGYIGTPSDSDVLKISMEEGDHLDLSALAPPAEENFQFEFETSDNMGISVKNTTNTDYWYHYVDNSRGVEEFTGGQEGSWEIWAEDDGVVTLSIYDYDGTVPYKWELTSNKTPAPREDRWPDSTGDATRIEATGVYTGTINTPGDTDTASILLEEGDTLYAATSLSVRQEDFEIAFAEGSNADVSINNVDNANYWTRSSGRGINEFSTSTAATYQIESESTGVVMLQFSGDEDGTIPYTWATGFSLNEPLSSQQAPSASLTATPETVTVGESVTIDASNSTDPDGSIENYEWDFDGDGVVDATTDTAQANHTFESTGTHSVRVTVTDNDGWVSTATAEITVISDSTGEHESGVSQRVFDAVAGADGALSRADVVAGVSGYIAGGQVDGVGLSRTDIITLVTYYISQ